SPRLRRSEYLVRKDRRRHWKFNPPARKASRASARVLPVDARRRRGAVGEPVETDIVEHRVDGERIFRIAVVIGPRLEFLVDPQRLTRGRVRKRIAHGLRTRRLFAKIATPVV